MPKIKIIDKCQCNDSLIEICHLCQKELTIYLDDLEQNFINSAAFDKMLNDVAEKDCSGISHAD